MLYEIYFILHPCALIFFLFLQIQNCVDGNKVDFK